MFRRGVTPHYARKATQYPMTEFVRTMADGTAINMFGHPLAKLPRAQQISVADDLFNRGFDSTSRAVKQSLGVSHG